MATASGSTDPNGDTVTYELDVASAVNYAIDPVTGLITLTQAGADLVNGGGTLPAPVVNATDGTLDSASTTGTVPTIVVAPIIARDDIDNLELELQVATTVPVDAVNYTLLEVVGGNDGTESNLGFTVNEGTNGTVSIEVKQTALVAVADAINVEVYNGDELVYVGTTGGDPLVGDVIGLELLGLTGNDTLTATVSGLEPGNYTVVVRKSDSALATLVEDVELADLGDSGIVLGPENQEAVLSAVEDALNTDYPPVTIPLPFPLPDLEISLGSTVRDILEDALFLSDGVLSVGEIVNALQTGLTGPVLNTVLGGVIDPVLDAVAEALLSNTLTLLKTTEVTATLTEYSFADDTVITGNVIDPDPLVTDERGEDTVNPITMLTAIVSSNDPASVPTVTQLNGVEAFSINGEYGVLIINENGEYEYTANGDYASSGQSEAFTYTIFDGFTSDTAELVIDLGFTIDMADGDDVVNITNNILQSSLDGLDDTGNTINIDSALNANIIGGDGIDTINLTGSGQTLSLSDIFQTEVIDISGTGANTLLVQAADIDNSGTTNPIYVKGDSDDTVDLGGIGSDLSDVDGSGNTSTWIDTGVDVTDADGQSYNVWQLDSNTQIYIDTDIVNII